MPSVNKKVNKKIKKYFSWPEKISMRAISFSLKVCNSEYALIFVGSNGESLQSLSEKRSTRLIDPPFIIRLQKYQKVFHIAFRIIWSD